MARVSEKAIYILYFLVFVDTMMWSFIYPLSPKIVQHFGKGATEIGILGSVGALGNGVAAPFLGALADCVGRKPVLITSMIGATIASVLTGFAQSYWFLLAARLVTGITGGTAAVAAAYISDVTTDEERPSYITRYQACNFLGLTLGPVLGGVVNELAGWRVACFVSASFVAINLICLFFLPESSKYREEETASQDADSQGAREGAVPAPEPVEKIDCGCSGRKLPCPVWIVAVGAFFQMVGFSTFEALGTLYVQEEFFDGDPDPATLFVSIALSCFAVAGLSTNLFLYDQIQKRLGLKGSIAAGGLCSFVALLGLGFPINKWVFIAEVLVFAVGENLMMTSVASIITMVVPDDMVGRALGIVSMSQNIASASGPFAAGAVYEHVDPRAPWFTNAGLKLLCIGLVCLIKLPKKSKAASAAGGGSAAQLEPETDSAVLLRALSRQTRHGFVAPGGHGAVLGGHLARRRKGAAKKDDAAAAATTSGAAAAQREGAEAAPAPREELASV